MKRVFGLMFMNAPMPYQSLDGQGYFLDVNQAFLDILGYSREDLAGKKFADILQPDWVNHFKENFPKFKAVGEILGVEFEMVKKDGSTILVYFNGKIQRDDQGRFLRAHCIFQDVTEKKRTEQYLQQVLEATDDGIWDYDFITGRFACSERFAEMLGYKSEDIQDLGCFCEDNIHPEDADSFREAFEGYVNGRLPTYAIELRLKTREGSYKWIYTRGRALQRDSAGRALRVVGAHTDITEGKQAEEELRLQSLVLDQIEDRVTVTDLSSRITYVNQAEINSLGFTREEILNQSTEIYAEDPQRGANPAFYPRYYSGHSPRFFVSSPHGDTKPNQTDIGPARKSSVSLWADWKQRTYD